MSEKTIETFELETELFKLRENVDLAEIDLMTRLASRWEARQYIFDGALNYASVAACIDTLDTWRRLDAKRDHKEMYIVFNGYGRLILALAIFDFIRELKADGFTVTVEVAGQAYEHAAILLAAASKRVMTPSSWLSYEELPIGVAGNTFDAENRIEWNNRLEAQQRRLVAERSRVKPRKFAAATRLKNWYVGAEEALSLGLVDEISSARPERTMHPIGWNFPDIPKLPENPTLKQQIAYEAVRKMRAEAALSHLKKWDVYASASRNGIVRFMDPVNTTSVGKAKIELENTLRLTNGDVNLVITSPGGSVTDGLGFIDMARQVNASGRTLNTHVLGYAASMGGVMLQCGKTRSMGRESWLLIHRVSSWYGDTTTKAKLNYERGTNVQRQCFGILAERSVFSAEEVLEKCRDHDWWLSAEEALKYGFIDEIR
jgi:ATP-dependent Clp protease protease subunit